MTDRRVPSVEEARAYISQFNFFTSYVHGPEEGDVYVATHARRFVETLRRLPPLPRLPRILELGAVPYSMTILLQRYIGADVSPLSFYEVESQTTSHVLENAARSERYEFRYAAVNVERDVYPFEDCTFDAVMCCEILEHLLINPSHMLYESHRVLKPGGYIVVSTPNVTRAENVRRLSEGRNINDAYHGNGIYGRHNREFTPDEVRQLLEACGFEVSSHETLDVYDTSPSGAAPGREDTIVTVARATRTRRVGMPPDLYVLMDEYINVIRPAITMGIDDVGHTGSGWYDVEYEGSRSLRWTRKAAAFHLLLDQSKVVSLHMQAHHPDVSENPVRITLEVAGHPPITREVTDHRWQDVAFDLPQRMTGPTTFLLSVDRDWTPGGADQRPLGIRVHRCRAW